MALEHFLSLSVQWHSQALASFFGFSVSVMAGGKREERGKIGVRSSKMYPLSFLYDRNF